MRGGELREKKGADREVRTGIHIEVAPGGLEEGGQGGGEGRGGEVKRRFQVPERMALYTTTTTHNNAILKG